MNQSNLGDRAKIPRKKLRTVMLLEDNEIDKEVYPRYLIYALCADFSRINAEKIHRISIWLCSA